VNRAAVAPSLSRHPRWASCVPWKRVDDCQFKCHPETKGHANDGVRRDRPVRITRLCYATTTTTVTIYSV
jgi:hypothetical protein